MLVESNSFLNPFHTVNRPLPRVKTATTSLYHCTNQSRVGQAVPKLSEKHVKAQLSGLQSTMSRKKGNLVWKSLADSSSDPFGQSKIRFTQNPAVGAEMRPVNGLQTRFLQGLGERAQGSAFPEHTGLMPQALVEI